MRLVAVSDTHNNYPAIPDGDILVHAGDGTLGGRLHEVYVFGQWLSQQPHKYKIFVPGNHDFLFQRYRKLAEEQMPGVKVLIDESAEIEGRLFYGSPWTPMFNYWAFMLPAHELKTKWQAIPKGLDVLVTHGPMYGVMDMSEDGIRCGCIYLGRAVCEAKPKLHIHGHIHGGYGTKRFNYNSDFSSFTDIANVSICDEKYQPVSKPMVWEV